MARRPGSPEDSLRRTTSQDVGPAPLQFRLKTLLFVTAVAALLFAAMLRLSALWSAALLWTVLLVAGHVVANALGTRATARSPTLARRRAVLDFDVDAGEQHVLRSMEHDPRSAVVPTTRLGGNAGHGLVLATVVLLGATIGSVVGTILIWRHNDGRLDWSSFLLAALSSAVIGAFLTFLSATCFHVATRAWREASHTARPTHVD
ncbi:MAG: hypothetical protein QM775_14450 [Pirellulales bacterium]